MEDAKFTVSFHLRIGLPDRGGRIYTKEAMEKAIEKFNEKEKRSILIQNSQGAGTEWAGAVEEMKIKDDRVEVEIITIDTPVGRHLKAVLEEGAPVRFAPNFKQSGDLSSVSIVMGECVDEATFEMAQILCETINKRARELGAKIVIGAHDDFKLYARYSDRVTATGFWLIYDMKTNKIKVETTDIEVDLHDPSSVDKLIHSLEELRSP